MRKGIYAIVKPKEDGHVDINLLCGDKNGLFTINENISRNTIGSVTRVVSRMNIDQSKYHFVKLNKVTYLSGIDDIATRDEFVDTLSVLAKAATAANTQLYAYNSGKIVFTTDRDLYTQKKDAFFGSLNKVAMEKLIETEVGRRK